MGNIQANRNLIFGNTVPDQGLDPKRVFKLEATNLTPDSDLVFKSPEGELHSLTLDEFLQGAQELHAQGTSHLSIQLPGGRSVVIELANLSRETLVQALKEALKDAVHRTDPAYAKELQQAASQILKRIRQPQRISPIERLHQAGTHADFVRLSQRQIQTLKANSRIGADLLDRAGIQDNDLRITLDRLLKPGGLVDHEIAKDNAQLEQLQHSRQQFLTAVDQARRKGQKEVHFQRQTYSLPQGAAEFLQRQSQQIQSVVDHKQAVFTAVKHWETQIPTTLGDLALTPFHFVKDVFKAYLSRAGIGDATLHGDVGMTVVAGEGTKAGMAVAKVSKAVRAANVTSNSLHGSAQIILKFLKKYGGSAATELNPKQISFLNRLASGKGGKLVGLIFKGFESLLETDAAKLIGTEGMKKIAQVFLKLGGKLGAEGAELILKRLSLGNVLAGYSAGYYTANALGLNYIDETIDGVPYKLRLSEEASWANLAAGLLNGTAIATSTPPGQPLNVVATLGAIGAELLAEYTIAEDKAVLVDVHHHLFKAQNSQELQHGLDVLRRKYGSLDKIQAVLGQTGDGQNLVGTLLRKILKTGSDLPAEVLNQAIGEILKGVDTRWFTDDDAALGFLLESLGPKARKAFEQAKSKIDLPGMYLALNQSPALQKLLGKLNDANRYQLLKILNEGIKMPAEVAMIESLYRSASSWETKGKMTGQLLNSYLTRSIHGASEHLKALIWNNLTEARQQGPKIFKNFLNHVQLAGQNAVPDFMERFSNQKSGQLLAWMIQAGAGHQQFHDFIGRLSAKWWEDDNITRAFIQELQALDISVGSLRSVLSQDDVKKLFDNLEALWTSDTEYSQIEKLAAAADTDTKVYMIKQLMSGVTFERAEKALQKIISTASPEEQKEILRKLDLSQLGSELETGQDAAQMMNRMVRLGFPRAELSLKLDQFFKGVQTQGLLVNTHDDDTAYDFAKGLSDKALQTFSDALKLRLFHSLDEYWTTGSEYALLERLAVNSSPTARAKMLQQLMKWPTLSEAQTLISHILEHSSDADRKLILAKLDLSDLGYTLGNVKQAAQAMNALVKLGLPETVLNAKLEHFFTGVTQQNYFASLDTGSDNVAYEFIKNLDPKALAQVPDSFRLRLFKNLDSGVTWQSEYTMMRKIAQGASNATKAKMIQYLMDQNPTTHEQEDVIWYILEDTPYAGGQFLDLIQRLDATQLASEIETDQDAAHIAVWIAKAYQKAGLTPPGEQLDKFLLELARAHRSDAITTFLNNSEIQAHGKALLHGIKAETLKAMTEKLMDGYTDSKAENAIYQILYLSSWQQFSSIMLYNSYRDRLQSELSSSQWKAVQQWYWEIPKHLS